MLTEEQHENLRKADLCACDDCREDRVIDGMIDRFLTIAAAQSEQPEVIE